MPRSGGRRQAAESPAPGAPQRAPRRKTVQGEASKPASVLLAAESKSESDRRSYIRQWLASVGVPNSAMREEYHTAAGPIDLYLTNRRVVIEVKGGGRLDDGPDVRGTGSSRDESAMEQPAAPAAGANNASITGTVTFNGVAPEMTVLDMAGDPECEELNQENPKRRQVLVLGDDQRIANVLVQIKGGLPAIEHAPATGVVEFDQGGCQYAPHVFALRVGQTLKILNPDGTLHNVHAFAKVNAEFNEAMPQFRTELEKVFDQAEPTPFAVKCDVHPWMNAWAAVFDHPYFAVTGSDGAFTIGNLPAGTYELEIWHERLPPQTHTVTVAAGEQATVEAVMEAPSS